ncbi:hypothetical protein DJ69_13470 [Halorubrum persicum]|uniref:DNA primase/polymerase bifunctional N-terminal domain-containing protein n=1 Tax=Halorubrum persicum TaxID=1383844 RepID=A0A2G1WGI5_9EURY|nr:bifunctional DNA primase/polymerase [Halorubrum persicum]PHQ38091.1 hypothetical protein DJ69_13470 [Halorubrum persicum]
MTYTIESKNPNEYKCIALRRLNNVSVNLSNIAIPLKEGTKSAYNDFKQKSNRRDLEQNLGNYGILAKGPLHFIDIDDPDEAPNDLLKKTVDTFCVSTPSEGGEHRYVVSDTPLPNIKRDWGEIRSDNQYVVGPGSSIPDYGSYTIENDAPIQSVAKDELEDWIGGFDKDTEEGYSEDIDIESLSEGGERLNTAHDVFSKLQSDSPAFFTDLMDRLNGGRGGMGNSLNKEDSNEIDTSRLDFVTLEHLYGVFKEYGKSHNESRGLAGEVYGYYSNQTPFTKDGQKRKWVSRDKGYKHDMLDNAIRQFDQSLFNRLLNQRNNDKRKFNEYSEITQNYVDFVMNWLIEDWDIDTAKDMAQVWNLEIDRGDLEAVCKTPMYQDTPRPLSEGKETEYPSPHAIRKICSELDRNTEETYRRAMKKMRKKGSIKLACIKEGIDYRVYPADLPDPVDAEHIRYNGEKYE